MKSNRLYLDIARPLRGPAPASWRSTLVNPSTSQGGAMLYSNRAQFRSGRVRSLLGLVLASGLALAPTAQALSAGDVLVIDFAVGTDHLGALFRVDPMSGARTLLADFGSGANPGFDPNGVAVERRTALSLDLSEPTPSMTKSMRRQCDGDTTG